MYLISQAFNSCSRTTELSGLQLLQRIQVNYKMDFGSKMDPGSGELQDGPEVYTLKL